MLAAASENQPDRYLGRQFINALRLRKEPYAQVKKALRRVAKVLAAIARDFSALDQASAVFSVRQVETEEDEPLPNVPKTVANMLRIDADMVGRMLEALKAINAINYISILGWAAKEQAATTNSASAFLGSEQKRADFGEMMFQFERVTLVLSSFNALVFDLGNRLCVCTADCHTASESSECSTMFP